MRFVAKTSLTTLLISFIFALSLSGIFFGQKAHAMSTSPLGQFAAVSCKKTILGMPTWYQYLPTGANCEVKVDGMGGEVVVLIIMAVIDILLTLAGILAVFYIIFGGFKYITSQAEPAKLAGARTTILNAVVGLVIAIVASQIISFIAGKLV